MSTESRIVASGSSTTLASARTVEVELFGVPRLIAGKRVVTVAAHRLGDLAADLLHREPALAGLVLDDVTGWPLAGYSFVVDERFTRDPEQLLREGTAVLLVSSAAGG